MSQLELELTYLASKIPDGICNTLPKRLIDVYVPDDINVHAKLRIRQSGQTYVMTKKVPVEPGDASKQNEFDIPLDKLEFEELIKVSKRKVVKDRYEIEISGRIADVDIFKEDLEGLVVIDFEFETVEEQNNFVAPPECLVDVTQEDFIAGGNLAGLKYEHIKTHLDKFNYHKLHIHE